MRAEGCGRQQRADVASGRKRDCDVQEALRGRRRGASGRSGTRAPLLQCQQPIDEQKSEVMNERPSLRTHACRWLNRQQARAALRLIDRTVLCAVIAVFQTGKLKATSYRSAHYDAIAKRQSTQQLPMPLSATEPAIKPASGSGSSCLSTLLVPCLCSTCLCCCLFLSVSASHPFSAHQIGVLQSHSQSEEWSTGLYKSPSIRLVLLAPLPLHCVTHDSVADSIAAHPLQLTVALDWVSSSCSAAAMRV